MVLGHGTVQVRRPISSPIPIVKVVWSVGRALVKVNSQFGRTRQEAESYSVPHTPTYIKL